AAALALALASSPALAEDRPLPSDPAVATGRLDNGLAWIVRRHSVPPGRANLWLHIHTGSLNETDRQHGIAHYLEHMAFNGSENFKPGSVVLFFQSLGMQFGRDQNAFTNLEQTTYQLSLPEADAAAIGKGMLFFSDVLFRLTLAPREIEAERQIIQEERRRGLSGRQRAGDLVRERTAPGTLLARRNVIGTEETINGVVEADFKDYYGRWYTASNATLMVVSDAETAEVVKAIEAAFGGAPKKARPAPQAVGVTAYERSFAIVASDPEVTTESLRIFRIEPARPPTTTVALYRDDLVARLGESALNRRFEEKIARGGTSYVAADVSAGNDATTLYAAELSGRAAPGKWKGALQELALELQRARAFGFTARELETVKKQLVSGAERAVETESTATNASLLGRMNAAVTSGDTLLSPAQRLALLRELLPAITPEEVSARFAREFDPKAVAIAAVLPAGDAVPSEAQLLEIGTAALAVKPEREKEEVRATKLLEALPEPGEVRESVEHTASRVWSAWLGNNTRVHYRFMDERRSQVTVSITLIGGDLHESADNRGITQAAQVAWSRPATKGLTSTDIRELMTGVKVTVQAGGGGGGGRGRRGGGGSTPGALTLTISGSPDDLETGFQLAWLLLTQPRIEESAFSQFQASTKQSLEESLKNPAALGARIASSLPFPDDEPRTKPVTAAQIDRLTLAAAQAWLDRLLLESPIEVAIVGDLPKDRAFGLAARYLGSLPARPRVSPETWLSLRTLKRPAGPRTSSQTLETPTKQAFVLSGFYGPDQSRRDDARALTLAARILSTRMTTEIREQKQLVYSIGAASRPATTWPGFGIFSAAAPTEPSKAQALVETLAAMYAAFAASGPTEAELDVARKQFANLLDEQLRDPAAWSAALDLLTWQGRSLDDIVNDPAAFQAVTAKTVKDTFARYADPRNAIVVVVTPAAEGK
ncbi:MAG: insulinase family protein, partial [Candidatus Brocadiae bacterium]|nr:insulinase family protein [Candidatus Brocadiia bacterium]